MSIGDAKKFFTITSNDEDFRDRLIKAVDSNERKKILMDYNLNFDEFELEEAFSNLIATSQFEERANQFYQLKNWWEFVNSD